MAARSGASIRRVRGRRRCHTRACSQARAGYEFRPTDLVIPQDNSAASYPPYRGTGTSYQAPGCAASGLFGGWVHLIGSQSNYTAQKNRSSKFKKVLILQMCSWARPRPNRANGLSRLQWGSTRSPRGCLTLDMVGYHGRGLGMSAATRPNVGGFLHLYHEQHIKQRVRYPKREARKPRRVHVLAQHVMPNAANARRCTEQLHPLV